MEVVIGIKMAKIVPRWKLQAYNIALVLHYNNNRLGLEVLAQLSNSEIVKPDVVTRVWTWDLTVVREFNFSRFFFLWWLGFEPPTLHILCIVHTN
jgi:hypothetical protein